MSRILLAWELGGNLGHITRLLIVANALRERGHDVLFALRDVRAAGDMLTRESFPFVQAPSPRSIGPREPATYPEILFHYGFADSALLIPAVRAWRQIYRSQTPDLIIFDHAPTALLAARGTGIPRVVFGTGFSSPPRVSPLPSIRPWQRFPVGRLQASEDVALQTVNAALQVIGVPSLDAFHELFDAEENILATLPELDHYDGRAHGNYCGPFFDKPRALEAQWPDGQGKKLFVYIRPSSPAFRALATTLRKTDFRAIWFAPGLSVAEAAELESPALRMVRSPIDVRAASSSADAAILHGGHGTTAAMLFSGVPVVLLPEHLEQLLMGRKVAMLGAGVALNVNLLAPDALASAVLRVIHNPRFATHAKRFARKYEGHLLNNQQPAVIARLEGLLRVDDHRITNVRLALANDPPRSIEAQGNPGEQPTPDSRAVL